MELQFLVKIIEIGVGVLFFMDQNKMIKSYLR